MSESLPSVLKNCSSYIPGEPGLITPIGYQRCLTISRRRMIASFSRQTSSRKSAFVAFAFADLDREVLGRRVVGDRVDDLERQLRALRHRADALRHRLAEGVVHVHEHRGARHRVRRLEQLADQVEAVAHDVARGLEVAEHVPIALLGDLRRGVVDHERHAALLGHLRDRRGGAGVERADQHVGALLDQALGAGARGVDVGLGVGVHQLDVDAEHLLDHAGGEVGALLARLADEPLEADRGKAPTLSASACPRTIAGKPRLTGRAARRRPAGRGGAGGRAGRVQVHCGLLLRIDSDARARRSFSAGPRTGAGQPARIVPSRAWTMQTAPSYNAAMDWLHSIALGAGLAWRAGIRLYAVLVLAGAMGRLGYLDLPPALEVLQHLLVMAAAGADGARRVPRRQGARLRQRLGCGAHLHSRAGGRGAAASSARRTRSG